MTATPRTASFALGLGALWLVVTTAAQAPSQRTQRVDPMTASVRGTITTAGSSAPVRGAQVRLSTGGGYNRLATTDENGGFELSDMPAGEYRMTVSRAGFTSLQFGQRRPFEPPSVIHLSEGERVTANVDLPRGGVISGRIYDEFGEPVAGTLVQALRSRMVQGRRRLQTVGAGDRTDDTGAFRLYGLAPGDYYVTASAGPAEAVKRDPPIFYPGTANVAEAQPITIGAGAEEAADFQLATVRYATVSGVVLNSSGAPVEAMVALLSEAVGLGPVTDAGVAAFRINADSGFDGVFTIENVPSGQYTLTTSLPFPPGGPEGGTRSPGLMMRLPETVSMPLLVNGDVSGLVLTTRAGAALRGTFVAESGVVRPLPNGIRVTARSVNAGMMMQGGTGTEFHVGGMSGPFRLEVQDLPEDWVVSAILVDGVDLTDQPIDLNGQNATAQVVLTDRISSVSGVVRSRSDTADGTVVVFPDDATRWTYPSRYVRTSRVDERGRFQIVGLPPGERYAAVAIDYFEDGEEQDPQWLDGLRGRATSFSLQAGERRSLQLDLVAR